MKNKATVVIGILLILNIIATCVLGVRVVQLSNGTETDKMLQYVMYVGTNDKDTYSQIISTDEAKSIIDGICLKYTDGYTIQDATGSWTDETGIPTHENTIICYFDGTDLDTVHSIADEIISALNQNTVLIEESEIGLEYYGGK